MQRVFAIRPAPGLARTVETGRALGLEMVAMPLSAVEPVAWQPPDAPVDAILLGSANAIHHGGPALAKLRHLPIYAVGDRTARAARDAGFPIAAIGSGGMQALIDDAPDLPRRLLHLAGEERLALTLPRACRVETRIVYRVAHRAPTVAEAGLLRQGGVVCLHSGAAAAHFARACAGAGVDRTKLSLAALAPRIAAAAGDGWRRVASALAPTDAALLAIAATLCQYGEEGVANAADSAAKGSRVQKGSNG